MHVSPTYVASLLPRLKSKIVNKCGSRVSETQGNVVCPISQRDTVTVAPLLHKRSKLKFKLDPTMMPVSGGHESVKGLLFQSPLLKEGFRSGYSP